MNIKYIALLSLTLVAGVNAESTAEKLDRAKKEFNQCKQSKWRFSCEAEKQAFLETREEFLAPHRENMKNGIQANQEIRKAEKSLFSYTRFKAYEKHQAAILKAWGSGQMVEAFQGRNNRGFLDKDKSTVEFCDEILDEAMRPWTLGTSSYIEDMIGNGYILNAKQEELDPIKEALKQEIRNQ